MRFYTWKDIERYILMHHDEWKDELYDIEVYPNEMVVYPTSTSLQSVMGTKQVLSFIAKGLKIKEDTLLPTVFLGMIPETFSRREKQEIKENLLGCFETTEVKEELLDNMIVELPFASELIHLTEWKQILNVLKDRDMYDAVKELVKPYCISEEPERGIYTEKQHQIITKQICDFANNQITAEAKTESIVFAS